MADIKVKIKKTDGEWLELGKQYISDLSSLSQSTSNPSSIQYGVLANSGSVTINDIDGKLQKCIEDGTIIPSGLEIEIYANNTLIQKHILSDAEYDANERRLSLQLTDMLARLSNVILVPLGYSVGGVSTLKTLFDRILKDGGVPSKTISQLGSQNIYMLGNGETMTMDEKLSSIKLPNSYNRHKNLEEFLNKICETCMINLHQIDGNYVFSTARPSQTFTQGVIAIPARSMVSTPKTPLFKKNKVGKVVYTNYKFQTGKKAILNTTYDLRDADNNFFIANVPNAKIKTLNDRDYLCWIVDTETSDDYQCPLLQTSALDSIEPYRDSIVPYEGKSTQGYINSIENDYTSTTETYVFSDDYYSLSGKKGAYLRKQQTLKGSTYALSTILPKEYLSTTQKLDVSIFAECCRLIASQESVGDGNEYTLPENEYLTQSSEIETYVNNILNDWGDGIKTSTVDLFCTNLYYEDGTRAKNWAEGEILKVGDSVCLPNDDTLWKVTGREFKWSGSPTLSVQLQEIKTKQVTISYDNPPNSFDNVNFRVWDSSGNGIKSGDSVPEYTTIFATAYERSGTSHTTGFGVEAINFNGETGTEINGQWSFVVSQDTAITVDVVYTYFRSKTITNSGVGTYIYNPDNYDIWCDRDDNPSIYIEFIRGKNNVAKYSLYRDFSDGNAPSTINISTDEYTMTGQIDKTTLTISDIVPSDSSVAEVYFGEIFIRFTTKGEKSW